MSLQCKLLRALLVLCALGQLSFFVLAWSSVLPPGLFMQFSATGIGIDEVRALGAAQRLTGAALALPSLLTLVYGLWRLERMLARFDRGAMFGIATIAHLRAFAGAVLASTALAIVEPALRALAFRHLFGDLKAKVSMGVSSEVLLLVLVCSLFYLITNMLHEGRRLAEENEGFV